MADLLMIDNGNGGDLVMTGDGDGNDLVVIEGWQNMILLALFGGNIEGNTGDFEGTQQNLDWWGNSLLFLQNSSIQFNSDTERVLYNVALTSNGRLLIEQAVKSDLAFMDAFAKVTVTVSITSIDRVTISVLVQEPDNLESNEFTFIWDATKEELSIENN